MSIVHAAGCRTSLDLEPDAGAPRDLALTDLARGIDRIAPPLPDLAGPDLAIADLSVTDGTAPLDLIVPPPPIDHAIPPDLVTALDLFSLPDLARSPDLSLPNDLALAPDLSAPRDLAIPPDLVPLPGCEDGVRDGAETDIDCGGGTCPACLRGRRCLLPSDCASGLCNASVCHARLGFAAPLSTPALGAPVSLVAGDWNGDGLADVAFALTIAQFGSFLGNGDGSFRLATFDSTPPQPGAIVAGDWNGDGKLDLAVACNGGFVATAIGSGDGLFARKQDLSPFDNPVALVSGDWNGDGRSDLAVADRATIGQSAGDVPIVLAGPGGQFGAPMPMPAGPNPDALATGDWNGDGKLDLISATLTFNGTVRVLAGSGSGQFTALGAVPTDANPAALAAGDWNRDGKLDVVSADSGTDDVSVLLGNGDGTFRPRRDFPSGKLPVGIVVADFDLDGVRDLAVVSGLSQKNTVSVLLGNGDGTFQPPIAFAGGTGPGAIVTADWNGDGRADLAVTDTTGNAILTLLNTSQ